MRNKLSLILIILSLLLIFANITTADSFDNGFWLRILSSILLITAMVLTIRDRNKTEE